MEYKDNKMGDFELKEIEIRLNIKLKENNIDLSKYDINKVVKMAKEKGIFK